MEADVYQKRIPGAVLLIERNGKIAAREAAGFQDRKAQTPMQRDTILRIASITKAIIAVAIVRLA